MSEELSKKKRTRAGHRGSAKRIIFQAQETIESSEINISKLSQYFKTLKKVETLRNLEAEILEAMEDGDELITEIEQADLSREDVSSGHNLKAIRELHNHVESHVRSLQSPSSSFGAMLASVIMNKQPHELRLAVTCVKVRAPDKLAPVIETRILLDSDSQRSYISRQLSEALGLKEEQRETLLMKAFAADEGRLQVCSVVSLSVETKAGSDIMLSLLTIPTICGPITGQPITCAIDCFPHLTGLELADSGIKEGEESVYEKFLEDASFRGGRYCVRLPWKSPRIMLPDNLELSQRRLFNLLKRLQQSPHILTQYDEIIQDQLRPGIVDMRMLLSRMQEPLLHIPRCYFHNVEESYPCKLIGFCDASQRAYAAVVFMKTGAASCTSLACLLSNTMQALQPEQKFDKTSCYTDSKIVLYWIRGYDKSGSSLWRTDPELNTIPEACAMELKAGDRTSSMTVHSMVVEESSRIDSVIRVEDFSTLRQLLGVTACVQKFITLLKFKPLIGPPPPPLPDFRVQAAPPFSFIGVDHAGPLYLKNGGKVWICLFTCCLVRAVHLELAPDLTAGSFIRCLRRFSAGRGVPQKVVSDNSKTFRSANKVLKTLMDSPEVERHILDLRIQWTFILEKGGFYKRLIQSMKRCLRKAIGKARMDYDELVTVLVEVEATLNSRPISYLSSEDTGKPLTPSHHSWVVGCVACLVQWKMEYLTELREIHSSEKRVKDTVNRIHVGVMLFSSMIQSNLGHYEELARWINMNLTNLQLSLGDLSLPELPLK
eukprot:Em0017g366a